MCGLVSPLFCWTLLCALNLCSVHVILDRKCQFVNLLAYFAILLEFFRHFIGIFSSFYWHLLFCQTIGIISPYHWHHFAIPLASFRHFIGICSPFYWHFFVILLAYFRQSIGIYYFANLLAFIPLASFRLLLALFRHSIGNISPFYWHYFYYFAILLAFFRHSIGIFSPIYWHLLFRQSIGIYYFANLLAFIISPYHWHHFAYYWHHFAILLAIFRHSIGIILPFYWHYFTMALFLALILALFHNCINSPFYSSVLFIISPFYSSIIFIISPFYWHNFVDIFTPCKRVLAGL